MPNTNIDLNALELANLGKMVRPEDWNALLAYARAVTEENAQLRGAEKGGEVEATIVEKLSRFAECAEDGEDVDIGRDWLDALTTMGLLARVQRSPARWEMTEAGDFLVKPWGVVEVESTALAAQQAQVEAINEALCEVERLRMEMSKTPVELRGVAETAAGGAGQWRECTGCYDTEDGRPTRKYAYSKVFGCDLGCGCSECGGLGVVWDDTDYAEMAAFMEQQDASPAGHDATGAVPEGWKLVPEKPTIAMCVRGSTVVDHEINGHACAQVYAAMLAAAPNPDKGE